MAVLEQIVASTGRSPAFIRMDNGPEMTAHAIRDWCRFSGTDTSYIEPGHPWENPYIESFTGKLRDELLDVEAFATLLEAKTLAEDFRIDYNSYRPHSSLGYRTPASFAAEWVRPTDRNHIRAGTGIGVRSRRVNAHEVNWVDSIGRRNTGLLQQTVDAH